MRKTDLDGTTYEIPIKDFEEDMNTESLKDKKEKILDLFRNHNELKSEKEYNKIKFQLQYACKGGDLELIKILLSETIEDDSENFLFKIDKTNKTASLFKFNQRINDFIVPRTVKHENNDYLVTSICGLGGPIYFYLSMTAKFEKESAVSTIYGNAFSDSSLIEIYFPKSLIELKEGWCRSTKKLRRIKISPSNGQFMFKEDKYLIGKSNENNDEFDIFLFVRRDIKEFSIPLNIKIIGSYSFQYLKIEEISIPASVTKICGGAFCDCENLIKVEIPTNSNLQTIGKYAFSKSKIKKIFIPASVTKICKGAFYDCFKLRKVEIPTNSNLQTIEENAFSQSNIEEIYFPKSLIELKEGWCFGTRELRRIKISPSNGQFILKEDKYLIGKSNQNSDEFDKLVFVRRDIKKISIPRNIKIIGSCSFRESKIKEIFIPPSVSKIYEHAFSCCYYLRKVEISSFNLQTIEPYSFSSTEIKEISIPASVTKICEYAFFNCSKLRKVVIPTNSNLQTIEKNAFHDSKIEEISIPSSVTKICESAFDKCDNLRKVEIPTNSNLQAIEQYTFQDSKIKEIFIPASVTKICRSAFGYCYELQIVEISEDSRLKSISKSSFRYCRKLIIMIPSSLKKLIKKINH